MAGVARAAGALGGESTVEVGLVWTAGVLDDDDELYEEEPDGSPRRSNAAEI